MHVFKPKLVSILRIFDLKQLTKRSIMSVLEMVVPTEPFESQKAGTSGLRKKVRIFMQKNYTENFVQCILNALGSKLRGSTLVIGGDGRFYNKEAIVKIIRICAANGVKKVIVGHEGILSTPAVSSLIRSNRILGGIVLTASHNPGGVENDFGIKYNTDNGGPATDALSEKIHELTKTISQYRTCPNLKCDINKIAGNRFEVNEKDFFVDVIDPTEDYVRLMKQVFDFDKLRVLLQGSEQRPPFKILLDSMNGVTGVYVKKIFVEELKAPEDSVTRVKPLEDFGGIHPDPNLTYAADLVDAVRKNTRFELGAAFDGDGDRNMIIGKNAFFVTPGDSLAVIANNVECIPYFQKNTVRGFARSMPTAGAVDRVAKKLGKEFFETPTGWKYFGNLMDAGRISLCGEESFGTGSTHIREKDGIWAVLAWLSIIEHKKMGVEEILTEHWKEFGRNYFTRYDYEDCTYESANKLFGHLRELIKAKGAPGSFESAGKNFVLKLVDNFAYTDPIDNSHVKDQGIRFIFEDGSRIMFRLSGTGSSGATIRLYIDSYERDNYRSDAQEMLKPLINVALKISKLKEFTGKKAPTVIT